MNKTMRFFSYIGVIALAVVLTYSVTASVAKANEERKTSEYYQIKALKLPEDMSFAGEKANLKDLEVYERVDRELLVNTYWQSSMLLYLKRAHKYFPVIEPILEKHGVPNDFKYLAVIESGLTNATSTAGAKGFWQFMPATAKEYGMEVNDFVDERYHLEIATENACKYLKSAKAKLGSWSLAAAAYNSGNKNVSDRLAHQKVDNYYDLLLLDETARYVPRLLAVKEIMQNPEKYGYLVEKEDLYNLEKTREVKVDSTITNMTAFAQKFDMTYKDLKTLNPWLRNTTLDNKLKKVYYIKVKD
jgi:membrane-bound lytic murein transglycosylase D